MAQRLERPIVVPPDYSGRGDDDWATFIARFNSALDVSGYTNDQKLRFLACSLKDTAFTVFNSLVVLNPAATYDQICDLLADRFNPPQQGRLLEAEFRARQKRSDETHTEFAAALENLAARAFPGQQGALFDRLLINQFVDGQTSSALRLHIKTSGPATLNAAVQRAIEIATILEVEERRTHVQNAPIFVASAGNGQSNRTHTRSLQSPNPAAGNGTDSLQIQGEGSLGSQSSSVDVQMLDLLKKISGQLTMLEGRLPPLAPVTPENGPPQFARQGQSASAGQQLSQGPRPLPRCYRCGDPSHMIRNCPQSGKGR